MTEETFHPFLTETPFKTLNGVGKLKGKILHKFPILSHSGGYSDLFWAVHDSTEGISQLMRALATDDDERPLSFDPQFE